MGLERWDPEKHLPIVGKWLRDRKMATDAGPADIYPPTGFIADGICVGFLYKTDAKGVAWLDNVWSNPESSRGERHVALEKLFGALYEEAKLSGFRIIMSVTPVSSIIPIFRALGAKIDNNHMYITKTFTSKPCLF